MSVEIEWNNEARALVLPFRGEITGRPSAKAGEKLVADAAKHLRWIEAEVRAGASSGGRAGRDLYERIVDGWMKGRPPEAFDHKLEIAGAQIVLTLHKIGKDRGKLGKAYKAVVDRWVALYGLPRTLELLAELDHFALDRFRDPSGQFVITPASRWDGERLDPSVPSSPHLPPTLEHFVDKHNAQASFWTHLRAWVAAADEHEYAEAVKVAEGIRARAAQSDDDAYRQHVTEGIALSFPNEERFWRPLCVPLEAERYASYHAEIAALGLGEALHTSPYVLAAAVDAPTALRMRAGGPHTWHMFTLVHHLGAEAFPCVKAVIGEPHDNAWRPFHAAVCELFVGREAAELMAVTITTKKAIPIAQRYFQRHPEHAEAVLGPLAGDRERGKAAKEILASLA